MAADDVVPYEASWFSTLRQEQAAVVAGAAVSALAQRRAKRVGVDASAVSSQLAMQFAGQAVESIDAELWQLR